MFKISDLLPTDWDIPDHCEPLEIISVVILFRAKSKIESKKDCKFTFNYLPDTFEEKINKLTSKNNLRRKEKKE